MNKLLILLIFAMVTFVDALRLKSMSGVQSAEVNQMNRMFAQLMYSPSVTEKKQIWNQVISMYDANADKKITYKEFMDKAPVTAQQLKDPSIKQMLDETWRRADVNKDGFITWDDILLYTY